MTEEFPSPGEPAASIESVDAESLSAASKPPEPDEELEILDVSVEPPERDRLLVPDDRPPCWWCAVGEAIIWFIGTIGVHIAGGLLAIVATFVAFYAVTGKLPAGIESPEVLLSVTSGEMCAFVLAAILAVSLRFWGNALNELNFSLPDLRHVLIIVLGTIPLSMCVSAWSLPVHAVWTQLQESYPVLKFLDDMNTMELVQKMAQTTSFATLVLVVAVLPAIGEELVFRGAIGRVLIANVGLWAGVILTSVLFGVVHIHPVHAVAVIPIGLALHSIYLLTRSFWIPMLLHFLNNAWAVLAGKAGLSNSMENGGQPSLLDLFELVTGAIATVMLGIALWQSRVKFIQPDGQEWIAPRFPVRVPPSAEIQRTAAPINSIYWYGAIACAALCNLLVFIDVVRSVLNKP